MFLRSPICSELDRERAVCLRRNFPGHSGFFRLRLCRANERVASGLAVVDLHRLVNTETAHRTRSGCGASRIIAATRRPVRGTQIRWPNSHKGAAEAVAEPARAPVAGGEVDAVGREEGIDASNIPRR